MAFSVSEAPFPLLRDTEILIVLHNIFKYLLRLPPAPHCSPAVAVPIGSWQQPEISSGQIPASRLLVTQQNQRISGGTSGLGSHRVSGQSWAKWTSFQPLLIGNPLSIHAVQTPDCSSVTLTPGFGKEITRETRNTKQKG